MVKPLVPKAVWEKLIVNRMAAKANLKLIEHEFFFDLMRDDRVLRIRKDHRVYLAHMIENFEYFVGSVIPMHVNGTSLVDMSGPRYHRLKGFGEIPFLFPSHTEPYDSTAQYLDFARLSGGETVLDIGAYSAVTSIIFAQLVGPTGVVYAFEADDMNHECAQINIEMAASVLGLKNIKLIHKAIWSHSEGVLFSNEGAMGSSAVNITGRGRGIERVVPSICLQDFFEQEGLDKADFVKVDIEGCEIEVLESSASFLKGLNARVIVEPHFVNGSLSTDRCSKLLAEAGYHVRVRDKAGEAEMLIEAIPGVHAT
jgi:FkbM family methyltransferase